MLGIEIYEAFRFQSTDDLAAALHRVAGQVEHGELGNVDDEVALWSLVGYEERPEDGPGMWVVKCHAHGTALYVGQGEPAADDSPAHRFALDHAHLCVTLTADQCRQAMTA